MKTQILFWLFILSVNVSAHEYWFEADKFRLAPNEKTGVHLYVGDGLIKDREERPFQLEKTPVFNLFSVDKLLNLKTSLTEGALPIYTFSAASPGNYLLAMERNWSYI